MPRLSSHNLSFEITAILVLVLVISGFAFFGSSQSGIRAKADNSPVNISAAGDPTLTYSDGILVYTSAQREAGGDASVTGTGFGVVVPDNIIYSLELTNQGNAAKTTNLKFTLPKGYTYILNTTTCTAGVTPCQDPPQGGITGTGINQLTWTGVLIPAGNSTLSFKLRAP